MYPPPTPKTSQRDARDFILMLDNLIKTRVNQMRNAGAWFDDDHSEFLIREMTDYLLATDPRKGIYAKGPND